VTALSIAIGKELILPEDVLEDLRWGALLHDVGKIAIDPSIQNKAARLTAEEYKYMMTHSVIGAGIVKPLANPRIVDTIMHHHDRYDGTGIDQQVKGDEIPLGARIVSVADSFDAITSDRPYHNALPFDLGIEEVKRCQVTQFDPVVVKAFLRIPLPEIVKDFSRENQ
jgi:HD-GYP domain-containing protein (c-di-GMP phosphodiesterase class II)